MSEKLPNTPNTVTLEGIKLNQARLQQQTKVSDTIDIINNKPPVYEFYTVRDANKPNNPSEKGGSKRRRRRSRKRRRRSSKKRCRTMRK